jgi:uncharacterized protein YkwD
MFAEVVVVLALGLTGDMPTEAKPAQEAQEAAEPTLQLTDTESAMLEQTNHQRTARGMRPLVVDPTLVESARKHANWMASMRVMRHTSAPVGENIAMGQNTVESVIRTWMNSSGHRANILSRSWNRLGAAAYTSPEGRVYWCLQFLR